MAPVVDELSASGALRLGAPLAFVPRPAAVAVAAADENHLTQGPGIKNLASLAEGAMIPVTETDADLRAIAPRGACDGIQFSGATRARLFDQGVLAAFHRRQGDGRKHIVGGGDDHGVHILA